MYYFFFFCHFPCVSLLGSLLQVVQEAETAELCPRGAGWSSAPPPALLVPAGSSSLPVVYQEMMHGKMQTGMVRQQGDRILPLCATPTWRFQQNHGSGQLKWLRGRNSDGSCSCARCTLGFFCISQHAASISASSPLNSSPLPAARELLPWSIPLLSTLAALFGCGEGGGASLSLGQCTKSTPVRAAHVPFLDPAYFKEQICLIAFISWGLELCAWKGNKIQLGLTKWSLQNHWWGVETPQKQLLTAGKASACASYSKFFISFLLGPA